MSKLGRTVLPGNGVTVHLWDQRFRQIILRFAFAWFRTMNDLHFMVKACVVDFILYITSTIRSFLRNSKQLAQSAEV
jgi:hypothetical protein